MTDYHNEIDPYAAQWTRNLMKRKLIPDGEVDQRDIRDVTAHDLKGFTRCHFFSGIAGWAYALRLARVPDDYPLWTGSCPCQPFSEAGKGKGFADERHLWPAWFHLISERRPPIVFGEQVASSDGYGWLDLVQADLEGLGYACGASVLPAAGVGAPHGRHRIWFVAHNNPNANSTRLERRVIKTVQERSSERSVGTVGSRLPDSHSQPPQRSPKSRRQCHHWDVEPSMGRVADGVPARVDKLRALGNSIVPQVAAAFIEAALECRP